MTALSPPPSDTQNLIAAKLLEQLACSGAHAKSQQLHEAQWGNYLDDRQEALSALSGMLTSVFATDKQRRLEQLQQDAKPGHPLRTPSEQALSHWCRTHITSLQSAECKAREQRQQRQEQTDLWAPNFELALDMARRHFATKPSSSHELPPELQQCGQQSVRCCQQEMPQSGKHMELPPHWSYDQCCQQHQQHTEQNQSPSQPPLQQQGPCSRSCHQCHQQQQHTEQNQSPSQPPLQQQGPCSRSCHQCHQHQQHNGPDQTSSRQPQPPLQRDSRHNQHPEVTFQPGQGQTLCVGEDHTRHDSSSSSGGGGGSSSSAISSRRGVPAGSPVMLPQKAVLCQALQSAKLRAMAAAMLSAQGPVHIGEPEECMQVPIPATLLALTTLHSPPPDPSTQHRQQQRLHVTTQQTEPLQGPSLYQSQEPVQEHKEEQQGKQPFEHRGISPRQESNYCVEAHMKIEKTNMQDMVDASLQLRQQAAALGLAD
eukprot:CAMPEP_0202393194 /NCGR_PEP_ID=MMETSP1127-20130417/92783_1 /ASSEMBLY_ACC=CAM_ASM_000462 /TAXON_ID=3047 /ORGANISM="Dunaliella tertiolecta, Strain CCMP1320" /LENGTH=482 /DNA_ID=CAMNT_0048995763 /DNA_START=1014 /DNA_END=2462 /DNA_ORIENTATION=-